MPDEKIKSSKELEFVIFCIEIVAVKLGVDAERVYQAFTEKSNILNGKTLALWATEPANLLPHGESTGVAAL